MNDNFWKGKKVLITGHTGFKGSWLSLWLHYKGAKVSGYSLTPPTSPSMFELCNVEKLIEHSIEGDISDLPLLQQTLQNIQPEIIIHMAAQPLVRESYRSPIETYQTNVMGTVYLLEAVRSCKSVRAVLNVTTDKCYQNNEWVWGYRENEPLGGFDPYSSSKACSELVTAAYRNSFFHEDQFKSHGVAIASARAGNVIGGGDWAIDRLVPDIVNSLLSNEKIIIRNPMAIRPWQHVLEPLSGYMLLSQLLYEDGPKFAEAWNFGPNDEDAKPVQWIVDQLCDKWGLGAKGYDIDRTDQPHEAKYLKLDCSKARREINWSPKWRLEEALDKVVEWTKGYQQKDNLAKLSLKQIMEYESI
jgi:CDP-glucose 4,6-dehydratase